MFRRARRRPAATGDPHGAELDDADLAIVAAAGPHSMAGRERHVALLRAVEYLERRSVPGAFAECGVWRGGSVLVMILKLLDLGVTERDIFLYDTFEGMTEPTAHDTSAFATPALEEWEAARESGRRAWPDLFGEDRFGFEQVQDLLVRTGYPKERLHFVAGRVEDTIPAAAPDSLALLRLDTDWYESTRHELEHLYPRLSPAGVLIIDDYGHWEGCRRAVDEYFASGDVPPLLLNRVDYTCVLAVKV